MRFSHSLPLLALLPALLGAPVPTLRTDDLSLLNDTPISNGLGLIDKTEGTPSNEAIPSLDSLQSLIERESHGDAADDTIDAGLVRVNLSHKRRSKAHSNSRSTRSMHGAAVKVPSHASQVNGTTGMVNMAPAAAAAAGHAAALPLATPTGTASRSRKRMTNGERLAKGTKPLPPTRRSSAPNRRASQLPMMNTPTLVVRVIASTGTDLGLLSPPSDDQGEDGLLTFDPSARDPIRFQFPGGSGPAPFTSGPGGPGGAQGGGPGAGGSFGPTGPNGPTSNIGNPFEISPRGPDDPLFGGLPRQLIGAIPHLLGNGELNPSSPNFANMGMGQCDQGSPLDLNLPPLPIVNTVGGLLSGLPQLLGKLPGSLGGLLGLNLGSGQSGQSGQQPGNGGSGPLGGLGGLLHIVGPSSGSRSGPASGLIGGLPLLGGDKGDSINENGSGSGGNRENDNGGGLLGLHLPSNLLARPGHPGVPGAPTPSSDGDNKERPSNDDAGLLGLHLPSNLLGRPGTSPVSSSDTTDASSPSSNGHSHSEPASGSFPLDTAPVPQQAQTAIWHCDEQGNMGASWQNPDGSRIPAQFFTGGPCAHTICLAADVEALKGIHGGDLAQVKLVAGIL